MDERQVCVGWKNKDGRKRVVSLIRAIKEDFRGKSSVYIYIILILLLNTFYISSEIKCLQNI